jgi:hypothetical protein
LGAGKYRIRKIRKNFKDKTKIEFYLFGALIIGFFLIKVLLPKAILSQKINFFRKAESSRLITIAAARMKIQPIIIPL